MNPSRWAGLLPVLLLAGCGDTAPPALNGYLEAEPVRVAAPIAGRLTTLMVDRGDAVQVGQPLFNLEQDNERAAVNEAAAKVAQARAQASDLDSGKRPEELAVIDASLRAAEAVLNQSGSDLSRQTALARSGFVSGANLDALKAKRDADAAKVAEMAAQLRAAKLAARDDSRIAARAGTEAAEAQLAQKQWALAQKTISATVAARVEDRYYQVGEWVPAGSPVLSLLSDQAIKARFYVPEPRLSQVRLGSTVTLACDQCGPPVAATVRFVAQEAEFTPPVIYSKENRARLVYRVEAWPSAADAARLRPGQPVDVLLGDPK